MAFLPLIALKGPDSISYGQNTTAATRHSAERARLEPGAEFLMIRKLKSGTYRLYSRKADPKTGRRRNPGTFRTRAAAEKHERAIQFFKRRR